MAKKMYVLADKSMVFNSLEDLTKEIMRLSETEYVGNMVIGTYLGTPELSSMLTVNVNGKTKRLNKSSVKRRDLLPEVNNKLSITSESTTNIVDESVSAPTSDLVCSFCGKAGIKKVVIEGFDTILCEYHQKLEDQLTRI